MNTIFNDFLDQAAALHPELAKKWAEEDARKANLREQLRQHCAEALIQIGEAIQHPNISRLDLEAATVSLAKALSVSCAIDPEDA